MIGIGDSGVGSGVGLEVGLGLGVGVGVGQRVAAASLSLLQAMSTTILTEWYAKPRARQERMPSTRSTTYLVRQGWG